MELDENVVLLQRQFLQLTKPEDLSLPPRHILKRPDIQAQIYMAMFDDGSIQYPSPVRYKSRVLKLLVKELEQSIDDPDMDEISDDLTTYLAETLAQPMVSELDQSQQKSYVTYSAPLPLSDKESQTITTLETPSLLAAAGTTGYRTWEAAKFLATYLSTSTGRIHVQRSRVIELGAGTGLVSMFCAKHFGSDFVLATDGTGEVVDSIAENMFLNQLDHRRSMDAVVLKWGHAVLPELIKDEEGLRNYNLVIGADIIFDDRLIPPLVSTLQDLFEQYVEMKGLISATVRNVQTVEKFLAACSSRRLNVMLIASSLATAGQVQLGLFHSVQPEIRIFEITRAM